MKENRYSAPALEKGLDILELLSTEDQGLTQVEISRALARSVSEIFRMLVVLTGRGYVALDEDTNRYHLTTLLFEVAHRTPLVKRLTSIAGPLMRRTTRKINQSMHIAIIAGDALLVVGQVDAPGNNVLSVRLGARMELLRASSGRVMLAFLPEQDLAEILSRVSLPEGVSEHQFRGELAAIRARGNEITDSFVLRGVVNISAPVIDHTGVAVAALTVPYLQRYQDPVSFDECCAAVIEAAATISRNIGGLVTPGVSPRTRVSQA